MTLTTRRLEHAALPRTALSTTFSQAEVVPGSLRRAAVLIGELLGAGAIVLSIPFVILAIGTPIALCLRLLLWVGGLL